MNKPATVAIYELKEQIINAINNSQLPAEVVKYIINDISNSLTELAIKQLEEDMHTYQEDLKKENNNKELEERSK